MNGYQQCILYLSSTICGDRLTVRNIDRWYIDQVSSFFSMNPFLQRRNGVGKKDYWCIKDSKSSPVSIPSLADVSDWNGFVCCYIELHGGLDLWKHKNRRGDYLSTPRLRIYGQADDLSAVMSHIPVGKKKIQYVSTQTGKTCMVAYQSPKEILEIFSFLDGFPRNPSIAQKWNPILGKENAQYE